jgi:hypothetical protein
MSITPNDARLFRARQLAPSEVERMMASRDHAVAMLRSPDASVQVAALLVCHAVWHDNTIAAIANACLNIISSSQDLDLLRPAVGTLGQVRYGTRDCRAARALAGLVAASRDSGELQVEAYLSLRGVWFGIEDPEFFKCVVSDVKSVLREHPALFCEEAVKEKLVPEPGFPRSYWEEVDKIDWRFVADCLSIDN